MTREEALVSRVERLEALVERQAITIEAQRERIEKLEAAQSNPKPEHPGVSRRTTLKAGGLAGLLALGSGVASADPQGQVGTADDPVATLYAESLNGGITGGQPLTSLHGGPIQIDGGELSLSIGAGLDVGDGTLGISATLTAPTDVDEVLADADRDPDGTYVVTDAHELQAMAANLSANYRLGNDIDASFTALWNDGAGFEPIGEPGDGFVGTLDGDGHTVHRLTIDRSSESAVGLFGFVWAGAELSNLTLSGVNVSGDTFVGGLVGQNQANLERTAVSGTVSCSSDYAGGLVGDNSGNVTESYALASVTGPDRVGGVAGRDSLGITRSFAAGRVSATDTSGTNSGGLIGENNAGSPQDSYWDTVATGQVDAIGLELGTPSNLVGLTTSEMQGSDAATNMTALDFASVWTTQSGDYPTLRVFEG